MGRKMQLRKWSHSNMNEAYQSVRGGKMSINAVANKVKRISNDQELIQSDPISCPQNQKGNN